MENTFKKLYEINVNDHIEKKGQFSYLSWPYAVAQLRLADPSASWEVKRFDGLPYMQTPSGCFVEVAVTVQSITLSQIHPVLDARNKPIPEPTAFDINTSIQRCLVKAIALHGLGLYIYAGEDLPQGGQPAQPEAPRATPKVTTLPSRLASVAQVRYIQRLLQETGTDAERVLASNNVTKLEELSSKAASEAIKRLEQGRARAA